MKSRGRVKVKGRGGSRFRVSYKGSGRDRFRNMVRARIRGRCGSKGMNISTGRVRVMG